ncbi:MAG: radical SAM protein [bacterium JZ-2024 1]
MPGIPASYLKLFECGALQERVQRARRLLSPCVVCPRVCKADRLAGEIGECGVGMRAIICSFGPHFGEEPVLVGRRGSGTVFFAGCNLRCVYCQNYEISQYRAGSEATPEELANIFLEVQRFGCHNLNLVTPSHCVPQILEALLLAIPHGFHLPLVYNTSAYDSAALLRLLDGVVDIYMPDLKYSDNAVALMYSDARGYVSVSRCAIREMHRQVGDLVIDPTGIAVRGMIVRHLVLPYHLAGSKESLRWLAEKVSKNTYLNIMMQYRPEYQALKHAELSRMITVREYREVVETAASLGFHRGIPFDELPA